MYSTPAALEPMSPGECGYQDSDAPPEQCGNGGDAATAAYPTGGRERSDKVRER